MLTTAPIEAQRFTFSSREGTALAGYHWPVAAPRGAAPLVIVHGYGEHARRHAVMARAAVAAGHPVYAFDQAGHGESQGQRAVIKGYEPALEAIAALVQRAATDAAVDAGADQSVRPVLFGHSAGGAMALEYALANPTSLAGLILSAPALLDAVKRPAWLLLVAGPIARWLPTLPAVKLDVTRLSRDAAEVQRYRDDPLIHHGGVPAVTGNTVNLRGPELIAAARALAVPTLVVHGEADGIMHVEGSRRLAAAAPSGVLDLRTFPGAYHELHHDLASSGVREQVLALELEFLARRGAAGG